MDLLKLCIIKPNKSSYSETFIQTHIDRLSGDKKVLYGGNFPLYKPNGKFLINNWWNLIYYLFEKRILKRSDIAVRNQALINYLQEERIQVVLAEYGTVGASIAKACRLAGVPLVIHFHGVDAHRYSLLDKFKHLYQEAFSYASALIAVSGDMRDNLIRLGAPSEKVHLIPYGVNTALFKPVALSADLNFLSIGRMVDKKAPLVTLNAFVEVVRKFPGAHLTMVGDGPLLEKAKETSARLNLEKQVTFTGVLNREAILSLMENSYCYIQHSVTAPDGDMEGTPNTILEAAAAGLPIVSTRHAGIKEAVIDGVTGFLVAENDLDQMANSMLAIASSRKLAEQLGAAARQHILKHYKIDQQIAKLATVLQQVAKIHPV